LAAQAVFETPPKLRAGGLRQICQTLKGAFGLDRIRIDRTRDPGSIDPVNPVPIKCVEQIHAVDRIAIDDSIGRDLLN